MVRPRHWKIYLIGIVLVVLVSTISVAYYVLSAPPITHLPILSESQALAAIPYPHYHNSTYKFSSGTTEWLVASQFRVISNNYPIVALFLFKIGGESGKDVVILGFDPKSNVTGGYFQIFQYNTGFEQNATYINVQLVPGEEATFNVDLGLRVQVYATVLYLPVAHEEIRVPINMTFHWPGPSL